MLSPPEFVDSYAAIGARKTQTPALRLLLLGALAGLFIALGGAVTNTAAHTIANVSAARIICGFLFPFGLIMVILTGAELFTGNCLISISVLERKASPGGMLRSWGLVYLGNFGERWLWLPPAPSADSWIIPGALWRYTPSRRRRPSVLFPVETPWCWAFSATFWSARG